MRLALTFVVILAATACKKDEPTRQVAKAAEGSGSAGSGGGSAEGSGAGSGSAAAHGTLALPPAEPGPAYFTLDDAGIVAVLPDGTAQRVAGVTGWSRNLTLGADGQVYATEITDGKLRVWRLSGATATEVTSLKLDRARALAVAKDGTIYLARDHDILRVSGKAKPVPTVKFPSTGTEDVTQLAVDADGHLVAADTQRIAVLVGDAWQEIVASTEAFKYVSIAGSGEQLVVAAPGKPLARWRGGKLEPMAGDFVVGSYDPALSTTGVTVVINKGGSGARLWDPGTGTADGTVELAGLLGVALDGQARLWWIDDGALTVAPLLGGAPTHYPIGTLPAIAGVWDDSHDGEIVVVGAGPTKLPTVEPVKVVGQVTGTIAFRNGPVANADVELCTSALSQYHSSPCEDNGARMSTTTNAAGEFSIANVPVGIYEVVFKYDGRWTSMSDRRYDLSQPAPVKALGDL